MGVDRAAAGPVALVGRWGAAVLAVWSAAVCTRVVFFVGVVFDEGGLAGWSSWSGFSARDAPLIGPAVVVTVVICGGTLIVTLSWGAIGVWVRVATDSLESSALSWWDGCR